MSFSTLGIKDAELRATQFAAYMATANPYDPAFNPHQGWDTTAAGIGYNVISENRLDLRGATCGLPGVGGFTGCYFSGASLSGSPVLGTADSQINFDWSAGSPAPSVPPANFSARWQGYFTFDSAAYSFVGKASDGVRVSVDGRLLIDNWQDQAVTTNQSSTWISRGPHLVTVECYARTSFAACHLTWQK